MQIIDTNCPALSDITIPEKTRKMIIAYLKHSNPNYVTDDDDAMLAAVIAERKQDLNTRRMDYLISFPNATEEELDNKVGTDPLEELLDDAAMAYENFQIPRNHLPYI